MRQRLSIALVLMATSSAWANYVVLPKTSLCEYAVVINMQNYGARCKDAPASHAQINELAALNRAFVARNAGWSDAQLDTFEAASRDKNQLPCGHRTAEVYYASFAEDKTHARDMKRRLSASGKTEMVPCS